jgi:hypothetical protein
VIITTLGAKDKRVRVGGVVARGEAVASGE